LTHIPIVNTIQGPTINEGVYTREGGGNQIFMDRIQCQEEIQLLLKNVFGEKKRINYEEYVKINQEITSEMFLSILTLLQTNLPCSVNYYRYKNNYEKYVGDDNSTGGTIKQLSSPRIMSKLSPVSQLVKS